MAFFQKQALTLETASDGSATGRLILNGRVMAIHYVKDDFADGVDFTITNETTGQGVWTEQDVNAAKVVVPRQPTHGQDGTASLYAGSGEPVEAYICFADDPMKIVIAAGGDSKAGTFIVVTG